MDALIDDEIDLDMTWTQQGVHLYILEKSPRLISKWIHSVREGYLYFHHFPSSMQRHLPRG